ncbi:hypothetical protein [Desulfolutivibrio sp.]|uniref:hypothetical protein n=1 Tax=Desulfolutivibrio sp. TaxID=2773296 RepID=UPI002F9653EA
MASFEGTPQEFHHYIGPRIRNAVNSLTRTERINRKGICDFCGKKSDLDSAHVHGKGRREIIESVLMDHVNGNIISIPDLNELEQKILNAHLPLSSTFKFICKSCHTKYDSSGNQSQRINRSIAIQHDIAESNKDFKKLYKVKGWACKPNQINNKIVQAFRTIEKKYGKVLLSDLENECSCETSLFFIGDRGRIKSHLSSMKTDSGNSHGKVFYYQDDEIKMYDVVKDEVEAHFPEP